jgi:hypothetical protein
MTVTQWERLMQSIRALRRANLITAAEYRLQLLAAARAYRRYQQESPAPLLAGRASSPKCLTALSHSRTPSPCARMRSAAVNGGLRLVRFGVGLVSRNEVISY